MTDVEHISRKGSAVPISWFPVPEGSELPEDLRGLYFRTPVWNAFFYELR